MSRPSEIYTKTVSVRIPMDYYIKLLQNSTENKMSISEYITMKLFENKEVIKENKEKSIVWKLKDTFSNKETYSKSKERNKNFSPYDVLKLKKGKDVFSKNGKWKLVAVHKGLNQVYEAE
jgi:hypothetical protein